MFELKVKPLSVLLASNVRALLLRIILKNQLFQEQESPFVIDLLSNLNLTLPQVRCVCFLAVFAL